MTRAANEAHFRAVIDTAVDGVILIDSLGAVLVFNPACEKLFGYRADEVIGQNVKMLMPPPYRDEHDGYLGNYHRSGERKIIGIGREVVGRRKDGSTFPMDLSVGEAKQEGGKSTFVGIIHDISERKRHEQALRDSEARVRAVVDTAVDGVILIDAKGRVLMFNPACETLFGYSAAEVIGQNVKMLMPPPFRGEHDHYLENYRSTGRRKIIGVGREVTGRRKDATTFPMHLSVGEATHGGETTFVGIVHDLTERTRAEAHVRELTAELVHTSRLSAMGQLSSSIAHELNQPLTAVMNYAEAARQMLVAMPETPPKIAEFLQKAVSQAERAGQIMRRLRSFVEKGPAERSAESLSRIVEEASILASTGARLDGIEVTFELAAGLPPVEIDKIQIQQVVVNLVRNAVEVLRQAPQRRLAIRTEAAEPGQQQVSISDSGPGITPEIAAQLFKPFVTTKKDGMGIGLSISQSIVEAHGGRLWTEPNPGGGTIFRFTVPESAAGDEP